MGRDGETLAAAWKRADESTAVRDVLRSQGRISEEEFDRKSKMLADMHIFTDEELEEQRKEQVKMVQKICSGPEVTQEQKTMVWETFGFDVQERMNLASEALYQKSDSGPDVTEEEKKAIYASFGLNEEGMDP